jgi:hypothetical protein
LSAFAVGGARFAAAQEAEADFTPGAVFGMSNEVDGNEVVAFDRGTDDRPEPGGTGSGTIEDMANSLILANRSGESSPNNLRGSARFLFATNAGSGTRGAIRSRCSAWSPTGWSWSTLNRRTASARPASR